MAEWQVQKRHNDWEELDYMQRDRIIRTLSKNFSAEFCAEMLPEIESNFDWWVDKQKWGIDVRSYLNKEAFDKSQLPKGDWDYYWVSAVEKSIEYVIEQNRKD
jgi:hypothetical protein